MLAVHECPRLAGNRGLTTRDGLDEAVDPPNLLGPEPLLAAGPPDAGQHNGQGEEHGTNREGALRHTGCRA